MSNVHIFAIPLDSTNNGLYGLACIRNKGIIKTGIYNHLDHLEYEMGITSTYNHSLYSKYLPDGWNINFHGLCSSFDVLTWLDSNNCKKAVKGSKLGEISITVQD